MASTVEVTTTLPETPIRKAPIVTPRLELQPLRQSDLDDCHHLRSQPDVMWWTVTGRPDASLSDTQKWLDRFIPPNDGKCFNFAIRLRGDASDVSGSFIGIVGIHSLHGADGWPELGYQILPVHWRKGYGFEAASAVVKTWWTLPREENVRFEVAADSVVDPELTSNEDKPTEEILLAMIERRNGGSGRILEKCGFVRFRETEVDEDERGMAILIQSRMRRPVST